MPKKHLDAALKIQLPQKSVPQSLTEIQEQAIQKGLHESFLQIC